MTVQELIEILNNVEDKSKEIYIESEGPLDSTCVDNGLNSVSIVGSDRQYNNGENLMCENTTIIVYDPYGNANLTCDGSLHEKAKELLTDFRVNQCMKQTTIAVCQKALAGTLVSMCKKNYPNYGWVKVYDPYNALTNSKYLKHYVQSPIPEIS